MKSAICLLLLTMIDGLFGYVESRKRDDAREIKNDEFTSVAKVGTWSKTRYCNYGEYAIGFKLKVEDDQGLLGDDSGANSFQLLCAPFQKATPVEEIHAPKESRGVYGGWGEEIKCKDGTHVIAFRTKVESYQGAVDLVGEGDDSGLNSVKVKCSDDGIKEPEDGGKYGEWSEFTSCAKDRYICGFRQKVEKNSFWDTFGMTSLRMSCCDANLQFSNKKGFWKQQNIVGSKSVSVTESSIESTSTTHTDSNSYTKSLSLAIKVGYKFSDKFGAEAEVTGTVSESTARAISRTSSGATGESKTHTCEKKYFYQFMMTAEEGRGSHKSGTVKWKSPYFVCTDKKYPRCPGGACIDADCQKCFTESGFREIKSELGEFCIRGKNIDKKIDLYKCDKMNHQKWKLIAFSEEAGKFIIRSYGRSSWSRKCLQVNKNDFKDEKNRGRVELARCTGTRTTPVAIEEQLWYYEEKQIKTSNNKCLTVAGSAQNGQKIQVDECKKSPRQKWVIVGKTNSWKEILGFHNVYIVGAVFLFVVVIMGFIAGFIAGCSVAFFVVDSKSPCKQLM